ncbi:MAG: hypothetical protein JSR87_02200 [Proteobacteria bacterium]|nr:hypothetical protein [Pseudomonadota bacterium]MBS0573474.1 hypothetical protein [Pseudomonadota bacterium]
MILIDAGERSDHAFDAKLLMAMQLGERGHRVAIDATTRPADLDRSHRYQAAPFLADPADLAMSRVLVIGAEALSPETLQGLAGYRLGADVPVTLTGRFADRQAAIGARTKAAYVLGREPQVIDLADLQKSPLLPASPLPALACAHPATKRTRPEVFLCLPAESLEDPATLAAIGALDYLPEFGLTLVLAGKGRELLRMTRHAHLRAFGASELPPATLAAMADAAAFLGEDVGGERMAAFAADLMQAGGAVIDATAGAALAATGAPALRGPQDLAALGNFLVHTVLPNRHEIGRQTQASPWLKSHSIKRFEEALDLQAPSGRTAAASSQRVLFVPTNGVGLGHAQRCLQVAQEMADPAACAFAAFPSCLPMIEAQGLACLPLVSKSPSHHEEYANDLVNYLRLRRHAARGSTLVFDGGYVFDSIYRTILERALNGVWIRRGLWQPGQIHGAALEREKVFRQVIIPDEAFDELNADYTYGRHISHVGPILRRDADGPGEATEAGALTREDLAERFGLACRELLVTMLGAGVAADRTAQMQLLCSIAERRAGCLHLIVVWPGASVPPAVYGWKNSRVVRTRRTLALCRAADLAVSAAGYNAFHEILYHQVPAIFVPQTASFMDDQERRARAASGRGLAETVMAHELLQMEREVRAFLDDGKAARIREALATSALPQPGNAAAARLIERSMTDGR